MTKAEIENIRNQIAAMKRLLDRIDSWCAHAREQMYIDQERLDEEQEKMFVEWEAKKLTTLRR